MATTDASPVVLAYAESLFNVAKTLGVVRQIVEECKSLREILKGSPTFVEFLEGPQIPRGKKRELVQEVFGKKLNPVLLNLFHVTIQRERAGLIPEILEELQGVAERAEGIYPAFVTTARELGFQDKLKLKTALEKFADCHLRINYEIRPQIKGGIIFKFEDSLVDASILNRLEKLERKLKGGSAFRRLVH